MLSACLGEPLPIMIVSQTCWPWLHFHGTPSHAHNKEHLRRSQHFLQPGFNRIFGREMTSQPNGFGGLVFHKKACSAVLCGEMQKCPINGKWL